MEPRAPVDRVIESLKHVLYHSFQVLSELQVTESNTVLSKNHISLEHNEVDTKLDPH